MNVSVIRCDPASTGKHSFAQAYPMDHAGPDEESNVSEEDAPDAFGESMAGTPDEPKGAATESLDNVALAQLISRVMRQDESALSQLYEQLSGRVYAVAIHITRQVASAEEVLQDTFWQVWRQAPRFDSQRGTATAWVLTMARSRALDAARATARDPVRALAQSVDDEIESDVARVDDPLDLLDVVRRDSALHAELAALDPLRRQLISLAFFRGLTHDEIADHTGLPLGTVKSHVRRALSALQTALGADFAPDGLGSVR